MKRRYRIGFLMINEHSSFNAAFGLARVLVQRGYNVMFFVKAGTVFPQYVNENGFESVIMETNDICQTSDRKKRAGFQPWTRLKNHAQRTRLEQNCLADLIKKESLDLFFLDNIWSYPFASVLARMRVPTILLFPNFGSKLSSGYPPVFSSMVPPEGKTLKIRYRFICNCLWLLAIITKGKPISLDIFEFIKLAVKRILKRIYQIGFERKLKRLGWKSAWSEWTRRPIIPEIVVGHRLLDWHAVASDPGRCYFGTADLFRKNSDFDWSEIESKDPIIYCSISTARGFQRINESTPGVQSVRLDFSKKKFRLAKRFIEVTTDAFSRRKDWHLVLACGPYFRDLQGTTFPPNIHLFERVPQLEVLTFTDLAITWGGAGTVRECVNFGVPMLVFPVWSDQFGNAARVSSRNLGIRGNILDVTPKKMIEMVERALSDKKIRSSVDEMKRQCNVKEEIQEFVRFIKYHTTLEL